MSKIKARCDILIRCLLKKNKELSARQIYGLIPHRPSTVRENITNLERNGVITVRRTCECGNMPFYGLVK